MRKPQKTRDRSVCAFPENLGEANWKGVKDKHLYHHLGLVCEMLAEKAKKEDEAASADGRQREAVRYFERATIGMDEPAEVMYYNDQFADMIL